MTAPGTQGTPGTPETPGNVEKPRSVGNSPDPGNPGEQDAVARLADDLAVAVRAVPGVADLHPGALGEVGTYLPGRRVAGVRLREEVLTGTGGTQVPPVEVHVVVTTVLPVRQTAAGVHAAVSGTLAQRGVRAPVLVHVADVVDPRT